MKNLLLLFVIVLTVSTTLKAQDAPYIKWEKSFGGSDIDDTQSIFLTPDGGCVIVGTSASSDGDVHYNHGADDFWVVKLDRYYDTLWTKPLGGSSYDKAYAIDGIRGESYVVVGNTYSNDGDVHGNHGSYDFWVVKLNTQGDTLWTKTLGGSATDKAYDVKMTEDGGCIVVGESNSDDGDVHGSHGNSDVWLVKLNTQGDTLWTKTLGGSSSDKAYDIEITEDGGYIVVGFTNSNDGDVHDKHGSDDYWVVKLNAQGDILWSKALGGSQTDIAQSISLTNDGGYMVVGYTYSNDEEVHGNHGSYDEWIVKLNAQGDMLWSKTLGGSDAEYSESIFLTESGDYIITGHSKSTDGDIHGNHGSDDCWVVKLNDQGDTLWTKVLGGSNWDSSYEIRETQDRSYIMVGVSSSTDGDVHGNHGDYDAWVVKLKEPSCLLGDYPFNDGNAYDESGNLNDGDIHGPIPEGDRFGLDNSSMHYDGNDDFIIIPHGVNNVEQGSISVWVHVENTSPDTFPVFTRPISGGGNDLELMINNSRPQFILNNVTLESDITIPHDDWVHIVCVWNGSDMELYINSQLHGRKTNASGTADDNGVDMVLGNGGSWYARGHIDDFQIFSCPLDPFKIDSLYHLNDWDANYSDICIYGFYPLDGNANDTVRGYNGTIVGATPEINRFAENGKALEFDGSGDSLVIPNGLNNLYGGSISIWINVFDTSEVAPIFTNQSDGQTWADLTVNHGQIIFTLVDTNILLSDTLIGSNKWYHIVGTWYDSKMELYLNGQLQAVGDMAENGIPYVSDCNLVLGANNGIFATVIMDEFGIYECPLNPEKINKIYHDRLWDIQPFKTECYTFKNNLLPKGFLLNGDSARIKHERFITLFNSADDGPSELLRLGLMPDGLDSVIVEWSAPVSLSDTGFHFTGAAAAIGDSLVYIIHSQGDEYDYGLFLMDRHSDEGPVFEQMDSSEIKTGIFRNRLIFTNDNMYFTSFKVDETSVVPFEMEYNPFTIDVNYSLKSIKLLSFVQMASETVGYNWIDDICIRLIKKGNTENTCKIADYKLNNNLADNSGNGYHLSPVNGPVTFVENRFKEEKKSVYLADGQTLYNSHLPSISGDACLSTWVYPDTYAGTDTSLIFINFSNSDNNQLMLGVFEETGTLFFGHIINDNLQVEISDIPLPSLIWTHLVLNRDSINKTYTLYVNGKNVREYVYTEQPLVSANSSIAFSGDEDHFRYKGRIDGVKLWQCQITPELVDSIYHIRNWPQVMCEDLVINITVNDANCGKEDGTALVDVSGGSGVYDIAWSNGDSGDYADSLLAGVYSVQITDTLYGCMVNRFFNINNTDAPNLSLNITNNTCYDETEGAITVNVSGGSAPYAMEWSTGETTATISNLESGNYSITIVDAEACVITASGIVTEPDPIEVAFETQASTCGNADGEITVVATGGTAPYTFSCSNGSVNATIQSLSAGTYTLTVTDSKECSDIFTTSVSDEGAPIVMIDSTKSASCGERGSLYISVEGGSGNYFYHWSNEMESQDLENVDPGQYYLTITDGDCKTIFEAEVPFNIPETQEICVVTVDPNTTTNLVVWEKVQTTNVDHYNIYREGNVAGEYLLVGTVPFDNMSEFTDVVANPVTRSWNYKISAEDACGNESDLSLNHKTIHLNINLGLGGTINLMWDDYEGFDYNTFYINRHTTAKGWVAIDSLPTSLHSYSDTPDDLYGLWYSVTVVTPNQCVPTSSGKASGGPYYQSQSNIEDEGSIDTHVSTSIQNSNIVLFPNPNNGRFMVGFGASVTGTIQLVDVSGKIIFAENFINQNKWVSDNTLEKGVYFVKVNIDNDNSYILKMIVE